MQILQNIWNHLLTQFQPLKAEDLEINKSFMRITAEDIISKSDVPDSDISRINGYGFRQQDISKIPCSLTLVQNNNLNIGESAELKVGDTLPQNTDIILPYNNFTTKSDKITLKANNFLYQNIIPKGLDIEINDVIIIKNTAIRPRHIMLAKASKIKRISVYKKPIIGIFINHSNSSINIIDSIQAFYTQYITKRLNCEIKIINTDSSVQINSDMIKNLDLIMLLGNHDLSKLNCNFIKQDLNFGHQDKMLISYKYQKPIMQIPCNYIMALLSMYLIVRPTIIKLYNKNHNPFMNAVLDRKLDEIDVSSNFLYGKRNIDHLGQHVVSAYSMQDDLMMSALVDMNCIIVLDNKSNLQKGSLVPILKF